MSEAKYPHLYFKEWPFQVVPDERFTLIWAGRRELLDDIHTILRSLSRREQSTINLMWAWFGSGKSHTLRHMTHLCSTIYTKLLPIYIEYPRSVRSFLDMYTYFITSLGVNTIENVSVDVTLRLNREAIQKEISFDFPDFTRVIELFASGSEEALPVVQRWIMADKVHLGTLRKLGISKRIETSDDAVRVLACIVRMIRASTKYTRVLWMIDEFQRIGTEKYGVCEDVNIGLHSVYNACPNALSLFLSFSVKNKQDIFYYFSKELIDRMGIQKILEIHNLDSSGAFNFVSDLLYEFRSDTENLPSPFFPFEQDAVKFIIYLIEKHSELKPRAIMQYFNAVLERAEMQIARGEMKMIDLEFAKKILLDYETFLNFQKESLLKQQL